MQEVEKEVRQFIKSSLVLILFLPFWIESVHEMLKRII